MNNGTKNRNRPTHELRLGTVRASIWDNSNGENQRFNVTLSRIYKDRENNQWKHTDSFGRDDLLALAKVADQAHSWIWEQRAQNNRED